MASQFYKKHELLGFDLNMGTVLGEIIVINSVYYDCLNCINKIELRADLLLSSYEFDVILGMH